MVEIHGSRAASLKDYHGDLPKILVFSISPLWQLWWPTGHSELFCMTSLSIADVQRHCQTRTKQRETIPNRAEMAQDHHACPTTLRLRISKNLPAPALALQLVVSFHYIGLCFCSPSCTGSSCRAHKTDAFRREFESGNASGYP